MDSTPATSSTGSTGTVREGVLVLAASTQAQAVRYETITDTLKLAAGGVDHRHAAAHDHADHCPRPTPAVKPKEPPVRWVIPVELIAALNAAQNSSFTLVLLPEAPQLYTTAGLTLADMRNQAASEEPRPMTLTSWGTPAPSPATNPAIPPVRLLIVAQPGHAQAFYAAFAADARFAVQAVATSADDARAKLTLEPEAVIVEVVVFSGPAGVR